MEIKSVVRQLLVAIYPDLPFGKDQKVTLLAMAALEGLSHRTRQIIDLKL